MSNSTKTNTSSKKDNDTAESIENKKISEPNAFAEEIDIEEISIDGICGVY